VCERGTFGCPVFLSRGDGPRLSPLTQPALADPVLLARHDKTEGLLLPALATRHGLITGATGTAKTIALQTLAESFSRVGVPVSWPT
jgi:MoxR-like ATPase